ncbi:cell division protein CrgA [Propioniciclava sinopodophylli]|uniref:Cell division protein CrgA n=1 Tax=Propioniciclava sinopodophylli TaxID=1837344 RepID=A0A4Q9KE13_9ACTN|nr:cell division protein CrgA [Propioniciclava sinopodophylli]TBT85018.1 cell division protein CrgA [Propioniciclava sinopodophylli]
MPESKSRKQADLKKKSARQAAVAEERAEKKRLGKAGLGESRGWVVPTFITLMLLGVLWLVVWYLTASTGIYVPGMSDIGNWNLLIAMLLMGGSFGVATLWK